MKGRRHGDEIVAALQRLGCVVYSEDEFHYWVARANVKTQTVRKWYLPASQEASIVGKLDHTMHDYMEAIRANEAERHGAGGSHQIAIAARPVDDDEIE